MKARTAWTYEDYAALPDDGKRYEIHDGELCEMTAPSLLHQSRTDVLKVHGVQGAPTLAVEIFSPSTAAIDRGRKRMLYARYGVPYLWFIDPIARDIEALALRAGEYAVVARVSGEHPVDLPPFTDLGLVPASLWPAD